MRPDELHLSPIGVVVFNENKDFSICYLFSAILWLLEVTLKINSLRKNPRTEKSLWFLSTMTVWKIVEALNGN